MQNEDEDDVPDLSDFQDKEADKLNVLHQVLIAGIIKKIEIDGIRMDHIQFTTTNLLSKPAIIKQGDM